jgi:hypothetical protein
MKDMKKVKSTKEDDSSSDMNSTDSDSTKPMTNVVKESKSLKRKTRGRKQLIPGQSLSDETSADIPGHPRTSADTISGQYSRESNIKDKDSART